MFRKETLTLAIFSWAIALGTALFLLTGCQPKTIPNNSASRTDGMVTGQLTEQADPIAKEPVPQASVPTLAYADRARQKQNELIDPTHDGWDSEAAAEAMKYQLGRLLEEGGESSAATMNAKATAVSDTLRVIRRDDALIIARAEETDQPSSDLKDVVTWMLESLSQIGEPRVHIKIIQVNEDPASSTALYEAVAQGPQGSVQQTATFECRWNTEEARQPKISELQIRDFEQVTITAPAGRWYVDETTAVMRSVPAFDRQLQHGLNHWSQRVERAHSMDDSVRNGLAIGDLNSDGLDDVYVCQGPGLPNLLLIQQADGTVRNVAAQAGVNWLDQTSSALILDLDNDSDQDIAIATHGGLLVMENEGSLTFKPRAQLGSRQCDSQSISAADYDNDGDLDLFLCVYRPARAGSRGDFVFHNATTGGRNRLFRNDIADQQQESGSKWTFTDVTAESGLANGATRYSLASGWEDFDLDGDQDLYVANDYGRNYLYRNDNGTFVDATESENLSDTGFGMSVSWGDANGDGKPDLYIGNMFSAAGNRITRQAAFQPGATETQRALYRRMAKGNSLFLATDSGFRDVSQLAGTEMGRWAWSSVFTDVDNDGWEDLLVANGYITTEDSNDL